MCFFHSELLKRFSGRSNIIVGRLKMRKNLYSLVSRPVLFLDPYPNRLCSRQKSDTHPLIEILMGFWGFWLWWWFCRSVRISIKTILLIHMNLTCIFSLITLQNCELVLGLSTLLSHKCKSLPRDRDSGVECFWKSIANNACHHLQFSTTKVSIEMLSSWQLRTVSLLCSIMLMLNQCKYPLCHHHHQ